MVNEIAPRVHNSGHWTIEACAVSQFENHMRAVAGWPLGSTERHSDAEMVNLIGQEAAGLARSSPPSPAPACTSTASTRLAPGARWATSRGCFPNSPRGGRLHHRIGTLSWAVLDRRTRHQLPFCAIVP